MTVESSEAPESYEIVSVQRAEPPPGAEGANWHRYVISFAGSNKIEGRRQGNLSAVTGAVEEIVEQLNRRHKGKYGRVQLVPTSKKTPNKKLS